MKRVLAVLFALVIVCTSGIFSLSAQTVTPAEQEFNTAQPDKLLVMTNRFENILNSNFAFGDELSSISALLSASELSLLSKAKDGTLPNGELIAFLKDMYGIDPSVYADEGKEALTADGVTEISPRGFSLYTHRITDFHSNEDGTFTVYSDVEIEKHEGETELKEAVSRFVPTPESRFGYHLISCELLDKEIVSVL